MKIPKNQIIPLNEDIEIQKIVKIISNQTGKKKDQPGTTMTVKKKKAF